MATRSYRRKKTSNKPSEIVQGLQLVVVVVDRRDFGLETLTCADRGDELLELRALIQRATLHAIGDEWLALTSVSEERTWTDISQWSNTDCGKA